MPTINELKIELTEKEIPFPEDADEASLLALLEDSKEDGESPGDGENGPGAPNTEPGDGNADEGAGEGEEEGEEEGKNETPTHFKGRNGKWYRKPHKPIPAASVRENQSQLRMVVGARKEAAAKAQLVAAAKALRLGGFSKKFIKAAVTEAFNELELDD